MNSSTQNGFVQESVAEYNVRLLLAMPSLFEVQTSSMINTENVKCPMSPYPRDTKNINEQS